MVVEQVVIDRDNYADITLAIPIDDGHIGASSFDPDSLDLNFVAIESDKSSRLGSPWSFRNPLRVR